MDKNKIEAFAKIPQVPQSDWGFIDDIKAPLEYHFQAGRGCDAIENTDCLADGMTIVNDFGDAVPETALASLKTVLKAKDIELADSAYQLVLQQEKSFEHEEFEVVCTAEKTVVAAADADGMRRGIYFVEDLIRSAEGKAIMPCSCRKKPFVKHRISRCFFGPTCRPPFFVDELTNDIDYYPEEYLNKLAHEGVNGLWLTIYLRDYPTSIMPEHGKDAEKRFAKLRKVVAKCLRYGIKIYLFMSEPKLWGTEHFTCPEADAALHPELIGFKLRNWGFFCTSSEAGKQYFRDTVGSIFANVQNLGGIINIMYGEDNGACVSSNQIFGGTPENQHCPLCSKKDTADVYAELASLINETMHQYNPEAEYIGWFYAPGQRDGSLQSDRLAHIASKFPKDCTFMLNFESGGTTMQLDKKRSVFDYSLAFVGPSDTFKRTAELAHKSGAKLQVGCSHEDAAVPYIPVPENLYDKYRFMSENGVSAAMQCWYFGNYPGLMNKAAGALSFLPFPVNGLEFLTELARPDWRQDAPEVAQAWHEFSMAYRKFPANIAFEWYGPLHNCIAWPLHLIPVNEPIAPSWILKQFPEVSGDRIGESLGYHHTIDEALELCTQMNDLWQHGLARLEKLKDFYLNDPPRLAEISLAGSVGLQIRSCCNLLKFYSLREDMLFNKNDHLSEMADIVRDEIANSARMTELCENDKRLGYHSEAEGYLFYPEKLKARIELLEELLAEDFPSFNINDPAWDDYTGRSLNGRVARQNELNEMENNISWSFQQNGHKLSFVINNIEGKDCTFFLDINRNHPPLKIIFSADGSMTFSGSMYRNMPDFKLKKVDGNASFVIDLDDYAEFIRWDFPLKVNVFGNDFAWVKHDALPARLMFGDTNYKCAGYLVTEK